MPSRRRFLSGLAAASLMGQTTWAAVGTPRLLSCGATTHGRFLLCGLKENGEIAFSIPLPARGHAGAAHPDRAQAVVFARRPGRFALVIDCASGRLLKTLQAPAGRHFYGHGVFSLDGSRLFTTENAYDAGAGIVGVWDARSGYRRLGEFSSGGIGPHEIRRMPNSDALVVANGGIETHPDTGRVKLNIPTMQPNLTYVSAAGEIVTRHSLGSTMRKNSIRHIDISPNDTVVFGMQWQGQKGTKLPLVGMVNPDKSITLLPMPATTGFSPDGYIGSVAFSRDGTRICASSPRGNGVAVWNTTGEVIAAHRLLDVCGIAAMDQDFIVTHREGASSISDLKVRNLKRHDLMWDNHLVNV